MPKFSIVTPVFNSYNLMEEYFKHFENQTFKDFELIIVDDKSTDNTYEELEKYKNSSSINIKLLKNDKNSGPGKSRNNGIEIAQGKYITFVDSDDYIENNTLEILNDIIESKNPDCIIFDYNFVTKHNVIKRKSLHKGEKGEVSKSDALIYSTGTTGCKVYLLKNIKENNIKFPNLKRNEDFVFNKIAMSICNKIFYCNENLYNYVENPNSLMHNEKLTDANNNAIGFELIEKALKPKYEKELEAIFIIEYLYAMTLNLIRSGASSKQVKQHIEYCIKKYPNIYKNESIKYMNIYQKVCIWVARTKLIFLLKILIKIKNVIRKIN